jgi:hypothetical protein
VITYNKSFKIQQPLWAAARDAVNGTRNGSSLALLSVMLKAVPALKACAA